MQDIAKTVANAWEAAWDRGKVEAFDAILAPNYRRITAGSEHARDANYLKQEIADIRTAFPDLITTIDHLVVDQSNEAAVIFWHSEGTFTNDLPGVPATGARVETRGSNLLTIQDGLIQREQVTWDRTELLEDLGVPSLRSAFEHPDQIIVDDLSGRPNIDAVKSFNRQFITGVTVVTTLDADKQPRGLAANSYASISLDPPLVLICVQKITSTHDPLFKSTHLGINIMSTKQRETVRVFASKTPDKFTNIPWHPGPHGSPLIESSAACIEAEIKERYLTKTHTVFISKVTHAEASTLNALIYQGGQFFDSAELTTL